MRHFKIILAVVVLILIFLLFRQNLDVLNHQVQFKLNLGLFSFQSVSHPLWVILAFTLFIGILGNRLYSLLAVLKLRQTNRQLHHDLELLKSELHTLKPQRINQPPFFYGSDCINVFDTNVLSKVAQAFQPVQTQAKPALPKLSFDRNSV